MPGFSLAHGVFGSGLPNPSLRSRSEQKNHVKNTAEVPWIASIPQSPDGSRNAHFSPNACKGS